MTRGMKFARTLLMSSALIVPMVAMVQPAVAAVQGQDAATIDLNIPAQDLGSALSEFARQSNQQLLYSPELVKGKTSAAVVGRFGAEAGLWQLLSGTGIRVSIAPSGAFLLNGGPEGNVGSPVVTTTAGIDHLVPDDGQEGQEIVVIGTNIRGIAPESSPTRTFTREDIDSTGAATAQDFIQTLTENFSGGSNANIPAGLGDEGAAFNAGSGGSFGSSVNLRGLSSEATLVLLNGRRLAPSSVLGDFTDISLIPASAIERVEILSDGASSIYGSDAVAGVVNFILRDDFDGLETSLRYGTGTENGEPDQYRASATVGKNWQSGHALVVYEFFNQDQIGTQDRAFAQQDILPNFLSPSQERHSVLFSAAQDVAPDLRLFANLIFSDRNARQVRASRLNPNEIAEHNASTKSLNMAAGAAWNLWGDWVLDFSGTYGKVDTNNLTINAIRADAMTTTDTSIWTTDAVLSGSLLRAPGGNIKLALGGHYRGESLDATQEVGGNAVARERRDGERNVYAIFGEAFIPIVGPENATAGIERLEINASGRVEDFDDFGTTANPKIGVLWSPIDGLNFRGTYGTSFKAPPLGRVGANDVLAAAFPSSFINSLLGLAPADPSIADVVTLILIGTDKNLSPETARAFTAGIDFNQEWGSHSLTFSTTWFDIDFEGRVGTVPIPGNLDSLAAPNIAFNNPDAFPEGTVIFFPTQNEINDVLDILDVPLVNPFGLDPFDTQIINAADFSRNLSRTSVSGFDVNLTYVYRLSRASLLFGFDGTFLMEFQKQAAPSSSVVDQLNTLFNPIGVKLRGRAGYSDDNFTAHIFLNYAGDYQTDSTASALPIDSWTTVDLNLSYHPRERLRNSILNNTVFRLSVINVFDNDPPQTPIISPLRVDGFDPTNASPLGRFIALEITKRF